MCSSDLTSFLSAYNSEGKPNLKVLSASIKQSGVYFIKDTQDKIVYVGYSATNLYKTIYRHFQEWNDKKQRRFVYPRTYKVRIIFTTPTRAALLEKYLITKMEPRDNNLIYENLTPKQEEQAKSTLNDTITIYNNEDYLNDYNPFD